MISTIAHLAAEQSRRYASRTVLQVPGPHGFQPLSWAEMRKRAIEIAAGLSSSGCNHGDRVGIISETRAEWLMIDQAVLALGAVVVGVYPSDTAKQVRYILEHAEAEVAFVENSTQLAKLFAGDQAPRQLKTVIVIDGPVAGQGTGGVTMHYRAPAGVSVRSLEQLCADGRQHLGDQQTERWEQEHLERIKPEDVATLIYTSGTTGPPKGVVLTHGNLLRVARATAKRLGLSSADRTVVFLPMAHSLQRVAVYGGLELGCSAHIPRGLDTLMETIHAAQPTVLASVPRIFEKIHARVTSAVASAPPRRQRIFQAALTAGLQYSERLRRGQNIPLSLRIKRGLAERVVFSKIRARTLGSQLRFCLSGGAPINLELLEFFHAIGILILEGYGLTETSAPATMNSPNAFKFGTVGRPLEGTEIRIAEDGEILIRGEGLFREYYKAPDATAEAVVDGWFHSGDIGEMDTDGYLKITDRKKDIIVTAGGKNIAPQPIEHSLKNDPLISQAVVHGDQRHYLVVLLTIDAEALESWSAAGDANALQTHVSALIDKCNATLPRYSQLKKFHILDQDFTVENGLLTPTMKVKRRAIAQQHKEALDKLYAE